MNPQPLSILPHERAKQVQQPEEAVGPRNAGAGSWKSGQRALNWPGQEDMVGTQTSSTAAVKKIHRERSKERPC